MNKKLIHFDWALKKLLRHKANFVILEGFLSELLKFDVKIRSILESEGNKERKDDKFNRVDMLVESNDGELMLVEIQNESQIDYFQRMLYGASKLITEYIKEGDAYAEIKKVYSINIVYFNLGQGDDYVYEYNGQFVGTHLGDILVPTAYQKGKFKIDQIADIFPKYYILKINNFDDIAKDSLDEWIYFLKNSEVQDGFKAKGLTEAKKKLAREKLSDEERMAYNRFIENRRIEKSVTATAIEEGERKGMEKGIKKGIEKGIQRGLEKGLEKGRNDRDVEIVLLMHAKGKSKEEISELTGLGIDLILKILMEAGKAD
ncbi:MAG: Rpn family recombination-promoting nuclease/putative transposase [Flammeovirgaceae bacterium]